MAITVVQNITANTHVPAYNDQWFTATSSETAQPNFQFYVSVTIYYNNGTSWTTKVYREAINTPPDGFLRFNVKGYTRKFIKNYFPILATISNAFSRCTNGALKVKVNIDERYGTTPTIYPGANVTYYVWNASLTDMEMYTYSQNNYLSNNGATFIPLNDLPDNRILHYSQGALYFLCASDNVISKAEVVNNDGMTQLSFNITNPLIASGNWYDRYISFQLNPSYLAAAGGANWIAANGTTVTINFYDNANVIRYIYRFVYNEICTKFYNYNVIYLNKKGGFDYKNFELVSEDNYNIEKTKMITNHYEDSSATGYNNIFPWNASQKTNTVQLQNSLTLNTNWLSDSQITALLELVSSSVVYLQDSAYNTYTIHFVNNGETKYKKNKKWNTNLSHFSYRQRT
jgi:hypothetical protein